MKLVEKTTRIYLVLTAVLLVVAGVVLYVLMTDFMDEEVTEKLLTNKGRIVGRLERDETVTNLPPIIELEELSGTHDPIVVMKDTTLYDPIEQEAEYFREVTSIESISGKTFRITLRQVIPQPADYYSSIGLILLFVMALLLLGLVVVNRRIMLKLWHPFYQNLELLKQFSLDDDRRTALSPSPITEFRELNDALERMIDKLRADYHALKQFAENASHEMQTPLAIIQTKLDEALQAPAISEDQANNMRIAYASARRLSRLHNELVMLTRIENRQFMSKEDVALVPLVERQLKEVEDFIHARNITVESNLEDGSITKGHSTLVEILLSNLIGNAIKHNIDGGRIRISVRGNFLTITNTGVPSSQPADNFFNRFAKGDPSSKSPGLGLAIVKSICETSGWRVNYTTERDLHTLTVQFSETP